jgi:hypothetical protein
VKILVVLILLGVAVGVIALFVRWEREGKEDLLPLVLLGLLIVEATIYPDQNTLPRSLFHPGSGSTQLRLPEIYITLALIARLIARARPTRIGLAAGLWLAFAAWMVVGAVEGHLYHTRLTQDLYEAKDGLYIVGAYALAAGVPVRRYIDSNNLLRLGNLTVVCITIVAPSAPKQLPSLWPSAQSVSSYGLRPGRCARAMCSHSYPSWSVSCWQTRGRSW